jgi:hypothetical protein
MKENGPQKVDPWALQQIPEGKTTPNQFRLKLYKIESLAMNPNWIAIGGSGETLWRIKFSAAN